MIFVFDEKYPTKNNIFKRKLTFYKTFVWMYLFMGDTVYKFTYIQEEN